MNNRYWSVVANAVEVKEPLRKSSMIGLSIWLVLAADACTSTPPFRLYKLSPGDGVVEIGRATVAARLAVRVGVGSTR